MSYRGKQLRSRAAVVATLMVFAGSLALSTTARASDGDRSDDVVRAAVDEGEIQHVMVIDMENENFSATFGAASPATYLNNVLLKQGELIENYYGTSHVSLGNYTSQVSGQAPTGDINNDCLNLASLRNPPVTGGFTNITPGTLATDQAAFPGQVVGNGCVFPASVATIADQLDAQRRKGDGRSKVAWRSYAEDMGGNPARDYGTSDPLGGTDCAHPPIGGVDNSNSASATDQYATRHNPFVYFHSVIDDASRCNRGVVPLGKLTVGANGAPDTFSGHLYEDLRSRSTTPRFSFVTPNLCNDGHDATCAGPNVEGTKNAAGKNIGGLVSMDLWLKHWMPMILDSPAYRSGKLLVVLTFDESGFSDSRACCGNQFGPNTDNPGFSPVLGLFGLQTPPTSPGVYPGGGQVGAVLFNAEHIVAGSRNTTGFYNHFSALRSYEDMLGLTKGGDDGFGHLGLASLASAAPFGHDVFNHDD
jgi:phosphatidylinositol-3-phosphatase